MEIVNGVPGRADTESRPPRSVVLLGYGGLIPFVASLLAMVAAPEPWSVTAMTSLLAYGACILSFLGAVHWGFVLKAAGDSATPPALPLILAVFPALIGWISLVIGGAAGLWILMVGFGLVLLGDLASRRVGQSPRWYLRLRIPLSAIVIGILLIGAMIRSLGQA